MFVRLLAILLIPAGLFPARADEYDDLRLKWRNIIVGTGYNATDLEVVSRLGSIASSANSNWAGMDKSALRTFLWSDSASTSDSSNISTSYSRLRTMALAYATPGCSLQGNASLLADLVSALDWMHTNRYGATSAQYGNWWDWEIGSPLQLTDICVLIYDQLTSTQRKNYMDAVNYQTPSPDMTGANKVWKARIVGVRGMVVKSPTKLVLTRDSYSSVFPYVTSGDGYYADGSFVQHSYHAYTAGYGASLLSNMVPMLACLSGSTWAVTDPALGNMYQWVYRSYEPIIYRGAALDSVRGRELSRASSSAQSVGHGIMDSILRITEFAPPADASRMKSMVKYWAQSDTVRNFLSNRPLPTFQMAKQILTDANVLPRGELIGHYTFASMDRVVHLGAGYGFGLSMCSTRMANFESINGENLRGWFTSDGMTVLYNSDLNQYGDAYWPTVDSYRLPGITADTTHNKLPAVPATNGSRAQGQNSLTSHSWVGGATLDTFGAAGMQLDGWGVSLTGKKSWFMFDDEIVCLGAGITSTDSRPIESIVENRKLNTSGNNTFTVNGTTQSPALGWSEPLTGVNWTHLAGSVADSDIGYYFPQPAALSAVREARSGAWSEINGGSSSTVQTRNYLRFGFDHGSNPTNATYQYVILPGRNARRSGQYAELPQISVIANDGSVQAVSETTLGITAANFWTDTIRSAGVITVDRKSSVLVRDDGTFIDVSVSDPTQLNSGSITLQLDIAADTLISAESGVSVTRMQPGISLTVNVAGSRGRTYTARFHRGTLQTMELTPVADANVYDGATTTNYGTLATLAVKKSSPGSNRMSYLRFNVPSWNGTLLGASLKLTAGSDTSSPGLHGVVKVEDNSWIESGTGGITWANKPVITGPPISTWTPALNTQMSANVHGSINGAGLISFGVYSTLNNDTWVAYASRENGNAAARPKLALSIASTPPKIVLTSPGDGDWLTHADGFSIAADVVETAAPVTSVTFYAGATLLGTDTTAPYVISATLGGGTHLLTAVATDSNGLSHTSLIRRIDIAYPPVAHAGSAVIRPNTTFDTDLLTLSSDLETPAARLRFTLGAVANGSATLLADGHTVRFTPALNYSGPAGFAYTVTDATTDDRTVLNYDFQNSAATDVSGLGRDGTMREQGSGSAGYTSDVPPPLLPQHTQSLQLTENGSAGAARVERNLTAAELGLIAGDWSVTGWFKRKTTANIDVILQLGSSGSFGNNAMSLVMNAGSNTMEFRNYAGSTQNVSILKYNVSAAVWHHFAVVRNGSNLTLYVDGTAAGSDNDFTLTFDTNSPVKFGGADVITNSAVWERWFNGSLADIAIFNNPLSAVEIARLGTLPTANFGGQSAGSLVNVSVLHAPVANSENVAVLRDMPVDIDLRTLASDVETPTGQLVFKVGSASYGAVALLPDGHTARFTPTSGYTGPAVFSYTVTDTTDDPRTFLNYRFQSGNAADSTPQSRDGSLKIQGSGLVVFNPDAPATIAPQQPQSLFLTENGTAGAARVERPISSSDLDLITADWSVAGWFKRTGSTNIDSILQLGESGGWGNNSLSLVCPGGGTTIELRNFSGTVQDVGMIKSGVASGVWHHFAIVRSGTTLSLYLNGSHVGSDSDFTFTFDSAKPIKLGGVSTTTSLWDRWWHGGLADFGVFSAALPLADVTRLATGPIANLAGQTASNTVTLTIDPPAETPYETWLSTRGPDIFGNDRLPSADPDGDGVTNLLEFALNGNPADSSSRGFVTSFMDDPGNPAGEALTLVLAVHDEAVFGPGSGGVQTASAAGITYTVEGSVDGVFPGAVVSNSGHTLTPPSTTQWPGLTGTGWRYHTFKLHDSSGPTGKGFLRLKVTQP